MNHAYNSTESSKAYEEFLASADGQIFREVIGNAFLTHLSSVIPDSTRSSERSLESTQSKILDSEQPSQNIVASGMTNLLRILDAGCGDGWLAGLLLSGSSPFQWETRRGEIVNNTSPNLSLERRGINTEMYACDAGEPLIASAQQKYPNVQFTVCDLNRSLPYEKGFFDVVTASMVIHDVEDELATLQNLATVLKPGGKLLATIVNPYYGYPIGEWKRGIIGRLLMKKPSLRLARFYNEMAHKNRPSFEWRPGLGSHFTPLSTHIRNATKAGFTLTDLEDMSSTTDSSTYNLIYQLHRFPIILLLEFTKI